MQFQYLITHPWELDKPNFFVLARAHRRSPCTTMSTSGLKAIAPVPTAADFLDIVLSKTQRKTPTVCSPVVVRPDIN